MSANERQKKTKDFKSIKSKFDLPTLLLLPLTSATLCLFSKEALTKDTATSVFSAALMSFIARTGLMYWANSKRKASPRVYFFFFFFFLKKKKKFFFFFFLFNKLNKFNI